MNDEIENRPKLRRGATETACRHWTPITLPLAEHKEAAREGQAEPDTAPRPATEKTPD
ncbi:hypothetical protein LZ012_11500 [Dechloromonas sp. XY25]|uniref:Uncharacterized protein n=1 Tax=Dechloromonas hankyongensis TaxID=2908002 RepID=A0ABS9K355_9RHOO|nr:hypothetical protein [Dechloromonas hankyongensis]MCG2577618.1 hypothetical protein [Dechloromonas hankyongensis]